MRIYVGCSLTHASEEYKNFIVALKMELKKNHDVLEFVGLEGGTERDVYLNDTSHVKSCDLFIAECIHPSLGLGFELGTAVAANKPILAVAQKEAKVTRLVLGIDHPKFTFVRYETAQEILTAAEAKIQTL